MTSIFDSRHFGVKRAFTLVELLVVIVIIGMLAGMLIPAVNYAREAARRGSCINNQRNIGIALINYATNNNVLPGHLNQLGKYADGSPREFSWVVAILPEIEENKRYEFLTKDTLDPTEVAQATQSSPPVLLCTSARLQQRTTEPVLSYVVNCGPEANSGDGTTPITGNVAPAFTLFKDRRSDLVAVNKKVKLDEIVDGTSNTVLLSENVQTYTWYQLAWSNVDELVTTGTLNTRSIAAVASLGFVWSNQPSSSTTFYSRINDHFSDEQLSSLPTTQLHARPSSMHPGLVVMLYGDGSVKPMNDDVGFGPYLSAVCPDDAKAKNLVSDKGLGFNSSDFTKETW